MKKKIQLDSIEKKLKKLENRAYWSIEKYQC